MKSIFILVLSVVFVNSVNAQSLPQVKWKCYVAQTKKDTTLILKVKNLSSNNIYYYSRYNRLEFCLQDFDSVYNCKSVGEYYLDPKILDKKFDIITAGKTKTFTLPLSYNFKSNHFFVNCEFNFFDSEQFAIIEKDDNLTSEIFSRANKIRIKGSGLITAKKTKLDDYGVLYFPMRGLDSPLE